MAEDDIYGGYNSTTTSNNITAFGAGFQHQQPPPASNFFDDDDDDDDDDEAFHAAVKTSYGSRPGIGGRSTAVKTSTRAGKPQTGYAAPTEEPNRPMTGINSVGYRRAAGPNSGVDAAPGSKLGPAPPLAEKDQSSPEDKIKILERKVHKLLEDSVFALEEGDAPKALELAKQARQNEHQLSRKREEHSGAELINYELSYAVALNNAAMYEACELYSEATRLYNEIIKNKAFEKSARLKINIGNICYKQKRYVQATKYYRMALDETPTKLLEVRNRVVRNMGHCFVKLGQYGDAIASYDLVLDSTRIKEMENGEHKVAGNDFMAAFNVILCHFAMGDKESMREKFKRLLTLTILSLPDDARYINLHEEESRAVYLEITSDDSMRRFELAERQYAEKHIMAAAKLIGPTLEQTFAAGFDWCIQQVKLSQYAHLANELQITKAVSYLKLKDFEKAIETLKSFEKTDAKMQSTAANNLSFLYFLEHEYDQAEKYADISIDSDKYNPGALVNKGNCLYVKGNLAEAQECYRDALETDSASTEALYNLGLCHKQLNELEDALDCFHKLHALLRNSAEVIYQIASIYDMQNNLEDAAEFYMTLISMVPTDPNALQKLGELYHREGDNPQAFEYHMQSHKYYPSNMDVIYWLGNYYVESKFVEKAIKYFEKAALIQPGEVKWLLMVASCYRRSSNYQASLETYKDIHLKFPENVECLRFLVRLCKDLGMKEMTEYATKLRKAEKAQEQKEKRDGSGRRRGSGSRVRSGAGSGRSRDSGDDSSSGGGLVSAAQDRGDKLSGNGAPIMQKKAVDASYSAPMDAPMERPKTRGRPVAADDDGDDLFDGDDHDHLPD